ncbi:hypothetical protein G5C51_35940, partial [Streptomyces sp. A7024]
MSDSPLPPLPADVLEDAADALGWLIEDMAEELEEAPTLEEVLDVLGWGLPEAVEDLASPFKPPIHFTAHLDGARA